MSFYRALVMVCLLTIASLHASAAIVFDFQGSHPTDGKTTASLYLKNNYIFGSDISAHDMIKLEVNSKTHNYTIYPKQTTHLYLAMNIDGSLANNSGNFQFYVDTAHNLFFGTRTDGTWRANYDMTEGNLGRWTLRTQGFKDVCLSNDNFHKAASRGDTAYVQQCIAASMPINHQEGNGWTALHSAASNERVQVLRLLLKHGANPAIKDKTDRTALDQATLRKKYNAMAILKAAN